jgi:DNA excision repair protein ERCC-1
MDGDFGNDADNQIFIGEESANTAHSLADPSGSKLQASSVRPSRVEQPKPQALPGRKALSAILVSSRQKGNPILNHVKLIPWEYADIPADYVIGTTTCALFLSLKYHRLHPEYIYSRIKTLAGKYNFRILLIMVDIPNHEESLKELSKTSIVNNLTLILCWSAPEAAHYLELFKSLEKAQPTAIRSQQAQSYQESLIEFVTTPRSINKSDAASLISTFGSLQAAINASAEQISSIPGWGEKKVQQWCRAVREDFRVETAKRRTALPRDQQIKVAQERDDREIQTLDNQSSPGEHRAQRQIIAEENKEEVMLHTVNWEIRHREMEKSTESDPNRSQDSNEGMTEGIFAALAKLRQQGGGT